MASFASVISLFCFRSVSVRLGRSTSDLLDKYHDHPSQFLPSASGDCASHPVLLRWICSLLGHVTRRVPARTMGQVTRHVPARTMGHVTRRVPARAMGHVTRRVPARAIWSVLDSLFQSQLKACTLQPQLLLQPPQQGDLSVAAYFFRLSVSTNPLAVAGTTIHVDALICHVLAVFGPNFNALVVNLTHLSASLNLQGLLFLLHVHEFCLPNQSSISFPSANMVYQR